MEVNVGMSNLVSDGKWTSQNASTASTLAGRATMGRISEEPSDRPREDRHDPEAKPSLLCHCRVSRNEQTRKCSGVFNLGELWQQIRQIYHPDEREDDGYSQTQSDGQARPRLGAASPRARASLEEIG